MCSWNKLFLKNSQNSQENTCVGVSILIKLQVFFTEHLQGTASVHKQTIEERVDLFQYSLSSHDVW